jgi:carbon storage regulator CsrA
MLVLSRKTDQTIMIGSDVVVTIIAVRNNRVRIGIEAPRDVRILRQELVPHVFESWSEPDLQSSEIREATGRTAPS